MRLLCEDDVMFCVSANGNRYEGSWKNDMKNGEGKFFYLDRGQVYTGTWVDDTAKCGTLEDFGRETARDPPIYPIPEVGLQPCENKNIVTPRSIAPTAAHGSVSPCSQSFPTSAHNTGNDQILEMGKAWK